MHFLRPASSFRSIFARRIGTIAVALDIDGVLLRGKEVLPGAQKSLQLLEKQKIPYIFITNGGGVTERAKAKDLEKKIGVKVEEDKILLSSTPMKALASQFSDKRVLILGNETLCLDVARSYGFRKVVSARQLHLEDPKIYPGKVNHLQDQRGADHPPEPVAAAMVFHDPLDWALEMQILTDLLRPPHIFNNVEEPQAIPFYACNADWVYTTEFSHPRFTQGAFVEAFRFLFESYTSAPLLVHFCGKPFSIQYRAAEEMLLAQANRLKLSPPQQFIGIGDNPASDIRGANNAGQNWKSCLVRTGVWQGAIGENDATDVADMVCKDVFEAVEWVVDLDSSHKEKLKKK